MTAITVAALQLALGSSDEATNIAAVSALVEEAQLNRPAWHARHDCNSCTLPSAHWGQSHHP